MEEQGKRERLRNGEMVELKPGVFGRLNPTNKTLELKSGKILPVSQADQRDLFPANEAALDVARRTESTEKGIREAPFGGEFFHQLSQSGSIGGIKDIASYFIRKGDEHLHQQEAERRVSGRISQESPFTSAGATIAGMAPEIYATGGMSALKAAPLLTATSAGSRIFTEPGEVAGEAGLAAGGGFLLDKGANFLKGVADRRALSRSMPQQQAQVQAGNVAGQQAVDQANLQQKQAFNALQQQTKTQNAALLHQHDLDLTARKNSIIQDQNKFTKDKGIRDAEVLRLQQEARFKKAQDSADYAKAENAYQIEKKSAEMANKQQAEQLKLAQSQYEESVKALPKLQREAQQEYGKNVVRNVERIEKAFPKNAKILSEEIGVPQFIQENINNTGFAGSKQGTQATRVLNAIFPEGESFTASSLAKKYKALEEVIEKSSPEMQGILNQFKTHLGDRLPSMVSDSLAYARIVPTLQRQVENEVLGLFRGLKQEMGYRPVSELSSIAKQNISDTFNQLGHREFIKKMQSGELKENIINKFIDPIDFLAMGGPKALKMDQKQISAKGINLGLPYLNAKKEDITVKLIPKLDRAFSRAELKLLGIEADASHRLGNTVKKTIGLAEPVSAPAPPIAPTPMPMPTAPQPPAPIMPPTLPPQIAAPTAPPLPPTPTLKPPPAAPSPQTFNPQALPTLPAAQGAAERTGDFLEKNLLGGTGLVNNPLAKLAGLKYLLGKGALPAEAAYVGMKGLTSPTAAGEAARVSFKAGGIQAIVQMASKYPSYHNGILENPQERRSLTKEIEEDPEIPIEQKALFQSKVNRGRPITERLQ